MVNADDKVFNEEAYTHLLWEELILFSTSQL